HRGRVVAGGDAQVAVQDVVQVVEVLAEEALAGPHPELGLERLDRAGGDLPLEPGQDGLHRVSWHQPRDEEVHGDRCQGGDQVEDEPPPDYAHARAPLTDAARGAAPASAGSRSFPCGKAGWAG